MMDQLQQDVLSIHDPCLLAPVLRHPSISQDQQLVAALQQTSKELQAAVAARLAGQLPMVLHTNRLQHAQALMQWLAKHARLLRSLSLHLPSRFVGPGGSRCCWAARVTTALEGALQHAAATSAVQLQSLKLAGSTACSGLLLQLRVPQLTELCVEVDFSSSTSFQAVAALTSLQRLELVNTAADAITAADVIPDTVLAPLASGLLQLTQLHIRPVRAAQLQCLPPKLQQLHVTVELCQDPQQLLQLAGWLQEHASIVSSLELQGGPHARLEPGWDAAMEALAGAFQAAAAPPAAAAAAAAAGQAVPAVTSSAFPQLQAFSAHSLACPVPEHLPISTLTRLACQLDWSSTSQVAALCSFTALHRLNVVSARGNTSWQAADVLAPLSVLQKLTSLQLDSTTRTQLQHLQLPQLRFLGMLSIEQSRQGQQLELQLGHLTGLSRLSATEYAASIQLEDRLPPNLQVLHYSVVGEQRCSLQALLRLTQLQQLYLGFRGVPGASADAVQHLSRLTSLQEMKLSYSWRRVAVDRRVMRNGLLMDVRPSEDDGERLLGEMSSTASAWQQLPLKALTWSSRHLPACVLQQIGSLQGLTSLEISMSADASIAVLKAPRQQLAAVLQPLTALRRLHLSLPADRGCDELRSSTGNCRGADDGSSSNQVTSTGSGGGGAAAASTAVPAGAPHIKFGGVAALLQSVGGLPKLEDVRVMLPMQLHGSAVQQLQGMLPQLLPAYMLPFCKVKAVSGSINIVM